MSDFAEVGLHGLIQMAQVFGHEVGQPPVLEVTPDELYRIELRRIRGHRFQLQPRVAGQQVTDQGALVVGTAIPEDDHRAAQVPEHFAQKSDDRLGTDGVLGIGMKVTSERIALINQLYQTQTSVEIHDLVDGQGAPAGTEVVLQIPI